MKRMTSLLWEQSQIYYGNRVRSIVGTESDLLWEQSHNIAGMNCMTPMFEQSNNIAWMACMTVSFAQCRNIACMKCLTRSITGTESQYCWYESYDTNIRTEQQYCVYGMYYCDTAQILQMRKYYMRARHVTILFAQCRNIACTANV